ncbi:alpha-amylase [Natroniella sulfidigena]|uniref:alpha-amylase n=1 Tax=Natroniella sulfidigena TaxID=723921 RepID=UPI00200ADB70|nr:alpha-amylase [Natroniella sulfidigena]MCK8816838.1 alpha-amylase [Natroniella sulfidigena]
MKNQTLMQGFYWEMNTGDYAEYYPEEADLWNLLAERAEELARAGITIMWIPPANKGNAGIDDVGYGSYDLWDLGEFKQKGTTRTKYGTKDELEHAIKKLHQQGIKVFYDAVLNHMMGADETEVVRLDENSPNLPGEEVEVWTKFYFSGRDKYSNFEWNWQHFNGTDCIEGIGCGSLYLFEGKNWDNTYHWEDDYLMGVDFDYLNPQVREQMKEWGCWLVNQIGINGFRLDAVRHIDVDFMREWINSLQYSCECNQELCFIGEAWFESEGEIIGYLNAVDNQLLKTFDFSLRQAFEELRDGNLDLRWLGGRGLVNKDGYQNRAVTFIDNHDTDRDQGGYGIRPISKRKYQAYTYILMREHGLPTVFWKDYYIYGMKEGLDKLLAARRRFAYGPSYETETNDHNTYSYVRAGSKEVAGSGLVMMITQQTDGGIINKRINSRQPDTLFYDYTGNVKERVKTDTFGYGDFKVKATEEQGWSVWVAE